MNLFHRIISYVFQPLLIPTYAITLLFFANQFSSAYLMYKALVVASIFVLTALMPFTCVLFLKKAGVVSSILLRERKERTAPYILTFLFYVAAIYFLWRIYMPTYIVGMMLGSLLALILIGVVNLWWKISAHLCGMGGLCAAVFVMSCRLGVNFSPTLAILFVISGLVATSRLALGVHTLGQTAAGFSVGFGVILLSSFFF